MGYLPLVVLHINRQPICQIKERVFSGGYFTLLTEWDGGGVRGQHCYIVYANDTKVKYLVTLGDVTSGITPLYNADGTLQVYGR